MPIVTQDGLPLERMARPLSMAWQEVRREPRAVDSEPAEKAALVTWTEVSLAGLILLGLYAASLYSYLLFHCLAEGFAIVFGCCVFVLAWNSRRMLRSHYLLFLGIAYLFVAILDFAHVAGYSGMAIFRGYGADLATQLWIAARYLESLSLLAAPFFLYRRLRPGWIILAYAGVTATLLACVFAGWFPVCFVAGHGLTPFKKISEYVICLILGGAAWSLHRRREEFDRRVIALIIWSILTAMASELCFTVYIDPYGFPNLVGHAFKLLSFYLLYKAIVQTGLRRPYTLLFRELARARDQLEERVTHRTAELTATNSKLGEEVEARRGSEQDLRKRVRELRCLSELTRIVDVETTVEGLLSRAVDLLPEAWQFPRDAAAIIDFQGQTFVTGNPDGCVATMTARILADAEQVGVIEVGYRRQHPPSFEGPFLWEERNLLDMVAQRLGHALARRRAEAALRESECRYRLLADNTLDVIWTMNIDLEFTYVNPAIVAVSGYAPQEYVGTNLSDHCDPASLSKLLELIGREVARGAEHQGLIVEVETLDRNGLVVPLEVHARVVFDDQGRPAGFQGTSRDIRERKAAEQKYQSMDSQLRQAQKMEAVGRLAGGVAHDFNNMLNVILGNADLAQGRLAPDHPLQQELQEILEAAGRSAALTRQLLAFARKQTISPQVLDLNQAVEGTLKMLVRLIGEDIELVCKPGDGLPPVKMDPGQVDQVLANLVVNARDAITGVGTITIETELTELDVDYCARNPGFLPGPYLVLAVSDTGSGMDEQTRSNIFEPFFTTKAQGQGTGLGLATVHGIVRQNQGMIQTYSELGQGTTFRIYLPALMGAGPDRPLRGQKQELPTGDETVLLVEDEPSLLRLTTRLLESLGYTVRAANGPQKAIQLFGRAGEEFDIVLTDLVMPDMNGRQLFEVLAGRCPGLKCLFVSGYTSNAMAERGVLDENVHFLQKPFTKQDLAIKLREAIEG